MPGDPNYPVHIAGIFTDPMCHFVPPGHHNDERHKDFSTIRRYRLRILSKGGVLMYKDKSNRSRGIKMIIRFCISIYL
jgi:hypothetical protein